MPHWDALADLPWSLPSPSNPRLTYEQKFPLAITQSPSPVTVLIVCPYHVPRPWCFSHEKAKTGITGKVPGQRPATGSPWRALNWQADVVLAHLDRSRLALPCHPARAWLGKGTRLWGAWCECPSLRGQRETMAEAGDPKAGEKNQATSPKLPGV